MSVFVDSYDALAIHAEDAVSASSRGSMFNTHLLMSCGISEMIADRTFLNIRKYKFFPLYLFLYFIGKRACPKDGGAVYP